MSATVSPIVPGKAAPQRADDRTALLAAHAKRQEARDQKEGHVAAVKRARELVMRAEKKLEKARAGIEEAKVESARQLRQAIRDGRETDTNGLMRAARLAEASAVDESESLAAASAQLRAEDGDFDVAIARADVEVAAEVRRIIAGRVRSVLLKARQLDAELLPLLGVLFHVGSGDGFRIPSVRGHEIEEISMQKILDEALDDGLRTEVSDYLRRRTDLTVAHRIAASWTSTCEGLRRDPDAEIPA
jgi:hypothetical protein